MLESGAEAAGFWWVWYLENGWHYYLLTTTLSWYSRLRNEIWGSAFPKLTWFWAKRTVQRATATHELSAYSYIPLLSLSWNWALLSRFSITYTFYFYIFYYLYFYFWCFIFLPNCLEGFFLLQSMAEEGIAKALICLQPDWWNSVTEIFKTVFCLRGWKNTFSQHNATSVLLALFGLSFVSCALFLSLGQIGSVFPRLWPRLLM